MSISEFSTALKNRALSTWFKTEAAGGGSASAAARQTYSIDNVNVLVNPVSSYRSAEQTAEKTAFLITKDTIRELLESLKGITDTALLDKLSADYFNQFRQKNAGAVVKRRKITVGNNVPAVYFPNIGFDTITTLVNKILDLKPNELSKYYEKGHVIGLTSELLQETAERIKAVSTTGSTGKSFLLDNLDKVISYYKRLDLASANLKPASNISIYAQYEKRASRRKGAKYLVELQLKSTNQKSAEEVRVTLGAIRKLFTPSGLTEDAIAKLIDTLQSRVSDTQFKSDLIQMRSSPPLVSMIQDMVVGTLKGTADVEQVYTGKNLLIGTKVLPKIDTSNIRKEAAAKIKELEALKKKVKSKSPIKLPSQGYALQIFSLQNILNRGLVERIKQNMGTGTRRDILNLRSGRFAESVKIERMTQSREGMITAFYSYMKNPYATFSTGGLQGSPKTRDPKLLIAKSIRELAAQQVQNRLRSVVV